MDATAPILIGNDGSQFAQEATAKGLWLADKVGAPVRIIRAWSISNAPRPKTWEPGYVPPVDDFAAAVLEKLQADVAPLLRSYPDLVVNLDTPHGAAGRELVKASDGARLLVVGTRGMGGFAGLLLGSVSGQVVEHARCDVLVVRPSTGDPTPPRQLRLDSALGE